MLRTRARRAPLIGALLICALLPSTAGGAGAGGTRTLVIILDAVPFATIQELIDSGAEDGELFAGFQPPLPVISTFPSSTSVAMVGLLEPFDLSRSPGYEARFFDWERRKVRGGGAISFFKIDFAWRDFFDWSRKGVVRSALSGLRPLAASGSRIEKAVAAFFRSDKDPYFVYLETTDLAAHMKGPAELKRVLVRLDAALAEARRRHPETAFRTVIFSDHGVAGDGTRLVNALPAVRRAAKGAGLRLVRRLRRPDDLVLIPFGLVSSFEAYAEPDRVPAVSAALVRAEGVDLCVYRTPAALVVEDRDGRARIEHRPGRQETVWRYVAESGDPLGYRSVADELGSGESGDFAADGRWLEATAGHRYPDALYRIAKAFELVDNPASVLCSLEPGFMYGLATTEYLARASGSTVRWTHGALLREATLGFLLTDDERFVGGGALRFDQALVPLTLARPGAAGGDVEPEAVAGSDEQQRDKMPCVGKP